MITACLSSCHTSWEMIQSAIHSCVVLHAVLWVVLRSYECWIFACVWTLQTAHVYTLNWLSFCFQPRSNKAEKFDYVSRPVLFCHSPLLRDYDTDDDLTHLTFSLFSKVMEFVKKMAGQEYVGFNNATWVYCQTHLRVFYVNMSMFCTHKLPVPLPCCIIDASVLTHSVCPSQVPVRKRNGWQKFCHRILHEREEGRLQNAVICGIRNAFWFLVHLFEMNIYRPISKCFAFTGFEVLCFHFVITLPFIFIINWWIIYSIRHQKQRKKIYSLYHFNVI